nr:type I-E CRISPR-associated protein Cas5/CasD [Nocardiopsis mwathae]
MCLAGPLQAWGSSARFARRTTENVPTKSGVLGMLAAAQGRDRAADVSDLAELRFGVRVDQRGTRIRDFQTAHHTETGNAMPVSERFYLADAVFVAGVEGDGDLIAALHRAVRSPVYLPYLGRRSCPPSRPVDIGAFDGTDAVLEDVFRSVEWQAAEHHRRRRSGERRVALPVFMDAAEGDREKNSRRDLPVSFDPRHRRYALRDVKADTVEVPNPTHRAPAAPSHHDPMPPLGGD